MPITDTERLKIALQDKRYDIVRGLFKHTTKENLADKVLLFGHFFLPHYFRDKSPDFHKVSNLPGNMSRAIRSLGKQLFRSMTRTPTDDIYVVANLGGQGPNSTQEVNAVANWVRKNGASMPRFGSGAWAPVSARISSSGVRWFVSIFM